MSLPAVEVMAFPQGAAARRAVTVAPGLAWLDFRKIVRSWRWRALVLVAVALAYAMHRGGGFGEGAWAAFPGGTRGVRALGLLFAAGALVLAVDLAGQIDRLRSRSTFDALPFPPLSVQVARLVAVCSAVLLPALVVTAIPFLPLFRPETAPLLAPSLVFGAAVWVPLLLFCSAAGLLGRSLARSDGAGIVLGLLLAAPGVWVRLVDSTPQRLFTDASPHLGILVPLPVLAADALAPVLAALLYLGLAALLTRKILARTPLRSLDPPRQSSVPLFRAAAGAAASLLRRPLRELLPAGACLVMGLPGALFIGWCLTNAWARASAVDFALLREPAGAGIVAPVRIEARQLDVLRLGGGAELRATLALRSAEAASQPLAALAFGPAVRVTELRRQDGGRVSLEPAASPLRAGIHVLRFEPPLSRDTATSLTVQLRAAPAYWRAWSRTEHPAYASFGETGIWWGEAARVNYTLAETRVVADPAPFVLKLPAAGDGESWRSAGAVPVSGEPGTLVHPLAGTPAPLFRAEMAEVEAHDNGMTVRFVVFPEHEALARSLLIIYADDFERLARAFGPPRAPLVFTEVPTSEPPVHATISSGTMDTLAALLPRYNHPTRPTAEAFELAFPPLLRSATAALLQQSFACVEERELLAEAWNEYLARFAFAEGKTREVTRAGRDYVLVPWKDAPVRTAESFLITEPAEAAFRGPLLARPQGLPPAPLRRQLAFHHALRGILGDEAYVRMLQGFMARPLPECLSVEALRHAAEVQHGDDLGWFFDQWLFDGVIPRYRIREAQVVLAVSATTGDFEYRTRAVLANEGDGRMPVPLVLETQTEDLTATVWLGAGEEHTVRFVSRTRPISLSMDPEGWIPQSPEFDPLARRWTRPKVYLKQVVEERYAPPADPEVGSTNNPAGEAVSSDEGVTAEKPLSQ